jgi:LPXTG-motif cell wall-anchored protein
MGSYSVFSMFRNTKRTMAVLLSFAMIFTSVDLPPVHAAVNSDDYIGWSYEAVPDENLVQADIMLDTEELKSGVSIRSITLPDGTEEENSSVVYTADENGDYTFLVNYDYETAGTDKNGDPVLKSRTRKITAAVKGLVPLGYSFHEDLSGPDGTRALISLTTTPSDARMAVESIELPDGTEVFSDRAEYTADKNGAYAFIIRYHAGGAAGTSSNAAPASLSDALSAGTSSNYIADRDSGKPQQYMKTVTYTVSDLQPFTYEFKTAYLNAEKTKARITLNATASDAWVNIDGIRLPDGSVTDGTTAYFDTDANGSYDFTVLYTKTEAAGPAQKFSLASLFKAGSGISQESKTITYALSSLRADSLITISVDKGNNWDYRKITTNSLAEQIKVEITVKKDLTISDDAMRFITIDTDTWGIYKLYQYPSAKDDLIRGWKLYDPDTPVNTTNPGNPTRITYQIANGKISIDPTAPTTLSFTLNRATYGSNYRYAGWTLNQQIAVLMEEYPDINFRDFTFTAYETNDADIQTVDIANDDTVIDKQSTSFSLYKGYNPDPWIPENSVKIVRDNVTLYNPAADNAYLGIDGVKDFITSGTIRLTPAGWLSPTTPESNFTLPSQPTYSAEWVMLPYNRNEFLPVRDFTLKVPIPDGFKPAAGNFKTDENGHKYLEMDYKFTKNNAGSFTWGWQFFGQMYNYGGLHWDYMINFYHSSFFNAFNQWTNGYFGIRLTGDNNRTGGRIVAEKPFDEYAPGNYVAAEPITLTYHQLAVDESGDYYMAERILDLGKYTVNVPDLSLTEVKRVAPDLNKNLSVKGTPYKVNEEDEDLTYSGNVANYTTDAEKNRRLSARTYKGGTITFDVPDAFAVSSFTPVPNVWTRARKIEYTVRDSATGTDTTAEFTLPDDRSGNAGTCMPVLTATQKITKIVITMKDTSETTGDIRKGISDTSTFLSFKGVFTDPHRYDATLAADNFFITMPVTFHSDAYTTNPENTSDPDPSNEKSAVQWLYEPSLDTLKVYRGGGTWDHSIGLLNDDTTDMQTWWQEFWVGWNKAQINKTELGMSKTYTNLELNFTTDSAAGNDNTWVRTLSGYFLYWGGNVDKTYFVNKGDVYAAYTTNLNASEQKLAITPGTSTWYHIALTDGEYLTSFKLHYDKVRINSTNSSGSYYNLIRLCYGRRRTVPDSDGNMKLLGTTDDVYSGANSLSPQYAYKIQATCDPGIFNDDYAAAKTAGSYLTYPLTVTRTLGRNIGTITVPASCVQGQRVSAAGNTYFGVNVPYYNPYSWGTAFYRQDIFPDGTRFYLPINSNFRYAGSDPRASVKTINGTDYLVYDMSGLSAATTVINIPQKDVLCLKSAKPGDTYQVFGDGWMDFGPLLKKSNLDAPYFTYARTDANFTADTDATNNITVDSGVVYTEKRLLPIRSSGTLVVAATSDTLFLFAGIENADGTFKESMSGQTWQADKYRSLYVSVPVGSDSAEYKKYNLTYELPRKGVTTSKVNDETRTSAYDMYPRTATGDVSIKIKYKRSDGTYDTRTAAEGTDFTVTYYGDDKTTPVSDIMDARFVKVYMDDVPIGEIWDVKVNLYVKDDDSRDGNDVYSIADQAGADVFASSDYVAIAAGSAIEAEKTASAQNFGEYLYDWYKLSGITYRDGISSLPDGYYNTGDLKGNYFTRGMKFAYRKAGEENADETLSAVYSASDTAGRLTYNSGNGKYTIRLQPKKNYIYELYPVMGDLNSQVITRFTGTDTANETTNNNYPRGYYDSGVYKPEGVRFTLDTAGRKFVSYTSNSGDTVNPTDFDYVNLGLYNNPLPTVVYATGNRIKVGNQENVTVTPGIYTTLMDDCYVQDDGTRYTHITDKTVDAGTGVATLQLHGDAETFASGTGNTLVYKPAKAWARNIFGDTFYTATSYEVYLDPFVTFDRGEGTWAERVGTEEQNKQTISRDITPAGTGTSYGKMALANVPTVTAPEGKVFAGWKLIRGTSDYGVQDPTFYQWSYKYDWYVAQYAPDKVGNISGGTDGPDGIPDIYQMKITYKLLLGEDASGSLTRTIGGVSSVINDNIRTFVFYKTRYAAGTLFATDLYPDWHTNPAYMSAGNYIVLNKEGDIPVIQAGAYCTANPSWQYTLTQANGTVSNGSTESRYLVYQSWYGGNTDGKATEFTLTMNITRDKIVIAFLKAAAGQRYPATQSYQVNKGSYVTDAMLNPSTGKLSEPLYGYTFKEWDKETGGKVTQISYEDYWNLYSDEIKVFASTNPFFDPVSLNSADDFVNYCISTFSLTITDKTQLMDIEFETEFLQVFELLQIASYNDLVARMPSSTGTYYAGSDNEIKGSIQTTDMIFRPVFTINSYKVNFAIYKDAGTEAGGSATYTDGAGNTIVDHLSEQTVTYKDKVTSVPMPTPTSNPANTYEFAYWMYTMKGPDSSGNEKTYTGTTTDPASLPITGDVTFTAVFLAKPFTSIGQDGHATVAAAAIGKGDTELPSGIVYKDSDSVLMEADTTHEDPARDDIFHIGMGVKAAEHYDIDKIIVNIVSTDPAVSPLILYENGEVVSSAVKALKNLKTAGNKNYFTDVVLTQPSADDPVTILFKSIGGEWGDAPVMGIKVSVTTKIQQRKLTFNAAEGTISAVANPSFTVTSGEKTATKNVDYGTVGISKPFNPKAPAGRAFMYWTYQDDTGTAVRADNDFLQNTVVTKDITLTAKYGDDTNNDGIADAFQIKFTYIVGNDDLTEGNGFAADTGVAATVRGKEVTEWKTRATESDGSYSETNGASPAVDNDAKAAENHAFLHWTYAPDMQKETAELRTLIFTGNTEFTAVFARTHWNVTYTVDSSRGTITEGNSTEKVRVDEYPAAIPTVAGNTGYTFVGWYKKSTPSDASILDPVAVKITEDTEFIATLMPEDQVNTKDGLALTGHGYTIPNSQAKDENLETVKTGSETDSWVIATGKSAKDTIRVSEEDLRKINDTGVEGGIHRITLHANDPDDPTKTVSREILVTVEGTETHTAVTEGGNKAAITALGFSVDNGTVLTDDDAKTKSSVFAAIVETGVEITDITVDQEQLAAINTAGPEGGIFDLTFTATADDGTTVSTTVKVVVRGTQTTTDPANPDGGLPEIAIMAAGFNQTVEEAKTLDENMAKTRSSVKAYYVKSGVPITDITAPETSQIQAVKAVGPEGGVFDLTFEATADDGRKIRTTVKDVVTGTHVSADTEDGKTLVLKAEGFTKARDILATPGNAILMGHAEALYTENGEPVDPKYISVDQEQLDAINAAGPEGGIFRLTYTVTDPEGRTASVTVDVVVPGTQTAEDRTGKKDLAITAHGFTTTVDAAIELTDDAVKELSEVKALIVQTGVPVENIAVDQDQLNAIRNAGPQGGIFDLTYTATDSEGHTASVTVKVAVTGTQTSGTTPTGNVPDPENPEKADVALTAHGFTKDRSITATPGNAIDFADAEAWYIQTGIKIDKDKITADQDQLDQINSAGPEGGIFDLTFTVTTADGTRTGVTVKVTVPGASTPVPDKTENDPVTITAKPFTMPYDNAVRTTPEELIENGRVEGYLQKSGINIIDGNVTVDPQSLKAVRDVGENGGIVPVTYHVTKDGRTYDVTVLANITARPNDAGLGTREPADNKNGDLIIITAENITVDYKDLKDFTADTARTLSRAEAYLQRAQKSLSGNITADQDMLSEVLKMTKNGQQTYLTFYVTDNGMTNQVTILVTLKRQTIDPGPSGGGGGDSSVVRHAVKDETKTPPVPDPGLHTAAGYNADGDSGYGINPDGTVAGNLLLGRLSLPKTGTKEFYGFVGIGILLMLLILSLIRRKREMK